VVVQGVVVQRDDGDPAAAQRGQDMLDLAVVIAKSPLIAARPPPRGWKFRAVVTPSPGGMTCPSSVMVSWRAKVNL